MRWNNKLNIWLAVKYVEKKTKRKPTFLANCFQYMFNVLLQFGALTSVFLVVVVVLNFSIFSKKRIKIFTNNWENRIECFNMIERTRERDRKHRMEAVDSKQNENSFRKKWNVLQYNVQHQQEDKVSIFQIHFFLLLFCVGCW